MLICIPLRFAQLLDHGDALVHDDDSPFNGCWARFYNITEEDDDEHHSALHGSTLGPRLATVISGMAGGRAGGKAKIGPGGGGDEEEEEPGPMLPCNFRQYEELLLIWAIPMLWFYLIFFAG